MGLSDLGALDGWQVGTVAARVHYRGDGVGFSVEYYAAADPAADDEAVLYWRVVGDQETAVPVPRRAVPEPLRERVRQDLNAAGIDPRVEERSV